MIRTLNHTTFRKFINVGLPDKKYIFLMLIKFITIKMIGKTAKNKTEEYFCLFVRSFRFDINVVDGIKKLFINSVARM